jgi:hypothetical protein
LNTSTLHYRPLLTAARKQRRRDSGHGKQGDADARSNTGRCAQAAERIGGGADDIVGQAGTRCGLASQPRAQFGRSGVDALVQLV